jgi:hypothetical protein
MQTQNSGSHSRDLIGFGQCGYGPITMVTVRYDIRYKHTCPSASWDGGLAVRELVAQFRNFTAVIQPYTSVHVLQNISVGDDSNLEIAWLHS